MMRFVIALVAVALVSVPVAADDQTAKLAEAAEQQSKAETSLLIGEFLRGVPYAEEALRLREAALGPDHALVADSALALGIMRSKNGEERLAEQLLTRALAIREKAIATDKGGIAAVLVALGELYRDSGDFGRAEPLLVRALASEETRGDSVPLADALEALAVLWAEKDDPRSEPMLRRAISIIEKTLGPDKAALTRPLKSLADMLVRRGDAARAEPLYQRSMAILENTGDLGDPRRAAALIDYARLESARGHHSEALKFGNFAYTIDEGILGTRHPRLSRDLIALARFARAAGDADRAERYTWRAIAIRERISGGDHPEVGTALVELATAYATRGDHANAKKLMTRALGVFKRSLGKRHPTVATTLVGLARLAMAQNDVDGALAAMTEAGDIREASLEILLYAGSERQKRLYLATLADETDAAISLHVQFASTRPEAAKLALLTLLRRKGRVLDTMADTIGALRSRVSPQDAAALDKLATIRAKLASRVLRGPVNAKPAEHAAEIKALEEQSQQAEAEISARSPTLRAGRTPVTLEGVQAAIPAGHALVEIASYRPQAGERRYVAYVLQPTGDPRWVDLGPEAAIDALVTQVRTAFADPKQDPSKPARELDALTLAPVRAVLGTTRELLVSPDGQLNLVPFGALVDPQGKYLIETYSISYLTTGRDLLRIAAPLPPTTKGALVVAAPTFGSTADRDAEPGSQRRSFDLREMSFPPLPGTLQEGTALKRLFGDKSVMLGDAATEGQIKSTHAPSVLHIATHGFFLQDAEPDEVSDERPPADEAPAPTLAAAENPLLRSGLAFSGANRLASGKDDGVLTALEASGLNLYGTQVVVLSACETGIGEVQNGEGVYGLKRAFVIAGSESQVISLWQVDDNSTRDLMVGYYERLVTGVGRAEALRIAQRALLATESHKHPFYWAAFIQSGDWHPIRASLTGTAATPPKVARGARGCGCDSTPTRDGATGLFAILFAIMFALRRRRSASRAAAIMTLAVVFAAPSVGSTAPATFTLPASKLELLLPKLAAEWTVTDASTSPLDAHTWDRLERIQGPKLTVLLNRTLAPTSCALTINMRHLDGLKGSRVVTAPFYLPAGMHPEVLEDAGANGVSAMVCAEIPSGTVTGMIIYDGTSWKTDGALVTPLLREFALAAAWGPGGVRPVAARTVILKESKISLELSVGWRDGGVSTADTIWRAELGKPGLGIGIPFPERRPTKPGKQPPKQKESWNNCQFWASGKEIKPDPDVALIARPSWVPATYDARATLEMYPGGDQLTLCQDTSDSRRLVVIEYGGAWTDPVLADVTPILAAIAKNP